MQIDHRAAATEVGGAKNSADRAGAAGVGGTDQDYTCCMQTLFSKEHDSSMGYWLQHACHGGYQGPAPGIHMATPIML